MEDSAPGLLDVLQSTSFAPHRLSLLALLAAGYAVLYRRATRIPRLRLRGIAFAGGLVALWLAMLSPIEQFGNELLWVNFTGFFLLTMVAAPLLVLASPLTLAFRVAGPEGRRRLRAMYRGFPVTWLTFPPVAWLLFAVVTYLWQFSSLTGLAAQHWAVRDLQLASLLLVGVVFWYPALAVDPVRWRMGYPLRGLYVLLEMTHKALFGGMFLSMQTPFHSYFVENVPAWGPTAMNDQRLGILILWVGGNLVFVAVLAAIAVGWVRFDARNSRRIDRRLEIVREQERRRRAALEQVFHKPV